MKERGKGERERGREKREERDAYMCRKQKE